MTPLLLGLCLTFAPRPHALPHRSFRDRSAARAESWALAVSGGITELHRRHLSGLVTLLSFQCAALLLIPVKHVLHTMSNWLVRAGLLGNTGPRPRRVAARCPGPDPQPAVACARSPRRAGALPLPARLGWAWSRSHHATTAASVSNSLGQRLRRLSEVEKLLTT